MNFRSERKEKNPIINTQLNRLAGLLSKFLRGIYFYWLFRLSSRRYNSQFISIPGFISSNIWHFASCCCLSIGIEFKPDKYSNFSRKYDCFQLSSPWVMRAELRSFCKFNQTILFCRSGGTVHVLNHVCTEHTLKFRRFMSATEDAKSLNYSKYSQPLQSTNSCVSLSSKCLKDEGAQKVRDMSSQSVDDVRRSSGIKVKTLRMVVGCSREVYWLGLCGNRATEIIRSKDLITFISLLISLKKV